MTKSLSDKAATLPTSAGVYLFRDRRGRVLYVGKAVNLRARVRQYLSGTDGRFMVPFLVRSATDVEVVLTGTEKEALLLENTLIKKHRPRYNVQLRDDKNFLHLRLDRRKPWPRYTLVRRIADDGARYFGPYHSASQARDTLAFLQRAFPLRTCSDQVMRTRKRPCLLYQMGRCVAPCVGKADPQAYDTLVDESTLLLDGRSRQLVDRLRERMEQAAEALEFEQAARLRDLIQAVERTVERQQVVDAKLADRDVWGVHREGDRGGLCVLTVREGLMGQPRTDTFRGVVGEDAELISSLLNATYREGTSIPPEILVPVLPSDAQALSEVLSERRGRKVVVRRPSRGDKVRLVELAVENARVHYLQQTDADTRTADALADLAKIVGLPGPPRRIECFDNSNLGGEHPVAAMSVFLDGRPAREEYRRYKVKTVVGADDYATMREILGRRLRRALDEDTMPDLLVVDGGKGQVAAARAVLEDMGLHDQPLIGISKPRTERRKGDREATDKLVLPNAKDPITLREGHPALRIVQHLRDEVHDHAIRYHRKVRRKDSLTSVLEGVPGVGPARRKALLRHLGSARAVFEADVDALAAVPGIGPETAKAIHTALRGG